MVRHITVNLLDSNNFNLLCSIFCIHILLIFFLSFRESIGYFVNLICDTYMRFSYQIGKFKTENFRTRKFKQSTSSKNPSFALRKHQVFGISPLSSRKRRNTCFSQNLIACGLAIHKALAHDTPAHTTHTHTHTHTCTHNTHTNTPTHHTHIYACTHALTTHTHTHTHAHTHTNTHTLQKPTSGQDPYIYIYIYTQPSSNGAGAAAMFRKLTHQS